MDMKPNYSVHEDDSKRAWFVTEKGTYDDWQRAYDWALTASVSGGRHFVYYNNPSIPNGRAFVGYALDGKWYWR